MTHRAIDGAHSTNSRRPVPHNLNDS
jgi:hypothetical protein